MGNYFFVILTKIVERRGSANGVRGPIRAINENVWSTFIIAGPRKCASVKDILLNVVVMEPARN